MEDAPITFEHNGKKYTGSLSSVYGAVKNIWHLMDDKHFYLGRLRMNKDQWFLTLLQKHKSYRFWLSFSASRGGS